MPKPRYKPDRPFARLVRIPQSITPEYCKQCHVMRRGSCVKQTVPCSTYRTFQLSIGTNDTSSALSLQLDFQKFNWAVEECHDETSAETSDTNFTYQATDV